MEGSHSGWLLNLGVNTSCLIMAEVWGCVEVWACAR